LELPCTDLKSPGNRENKKERYAAFVFGARDNRFKPMMGKTKRR